MIRPSGVLPDSACVLDDGWAGRTGRTNGRKEGICSGSAGTVLCDWTQREIAMTALLLIGAALIGYAGGIWTKPYMDSLIAKFSKVKDDVTKDL